MDVKGVNELAAAASGFAKALTGELFARTILPIAQEAQSRLIQDTPVRTGRLVRSTALKKESNTSYSLTQNTPYAGIVQARRNYWAGAIQIAQKWPPFVIKTVNDEWGVMLRKGGTK